MSSELLIKLVSSPEINRGFIPRPRRERRPSAQVMHVGTSAHAPPPQALSGRIKYLLHKVATEHHQMRLRNIKTVRFTSV